jgi:ribosomal protein S18 acetylase RimI-like enzyme
MSSLRTRNFVPEDLPQIMALQQEYQHAYPHAMVVPGEVYLSPGFEGGANIFCALDDEGCLQGYAPLLANLTGDAHLPNIVWAEVKTAPGYSNAKAAKDLLFEKVVARAREIATATPDKRTEVTFQYHPSETDSVQYVLSKGCSRTATVFRMMRDLAADLPTTPCPPGIDLRHWRMETDGEQRSYVQARNEAFPDAPVSLGDWQAFLQSPAWQAASAVTAFDGAEIVGSVAAYCDDALSQYTGNKASLTEYIFVRPPWRGRGIAAYLISESLRFLKDRGRDAAYLEVKASNEHALGLYRRLGYEVIDQTELYVLEL